MLHKILVWDIVTALYHSREISGTETNSAGIFPGLAGVPLILQKASDWEIKGACGKASCKMVHVTVGRQSGGPRVDEQQALVAQDAGVVHNERAGLLREVAKADCVFGLPPRLQLCFPLLSELVEGPSHSAHQIYCHSVDSFVE